MLYRSKIIALALVVFCMSFKVHAICNTSAVQDGIVFVSNTVPIGSMSGFGEVDVDSIQGAVDMVRECEFQISPFPIPADTQINIAQGNSAALITNLGVSINPSQHLLQINGEGRWYEIESISGNVITFTRPIETATGVYSFNLAIKPVIIAISGVYQETVSTHGIHYLTLLMTDTSLHGGFGSSTPGAYGHYKLDGIAISSARGTSAAPFSLGTQGFVSDIDVTLRNSSFVSVDSYDTVRTGSTGRFVIENSLFESRNDVFWRERGAPPMSSVVIKDSTFVSTRSPSIDAGRRKPLSILVQSGGTYTIENTRIISDGESGASIGVSVQGNNAVVNIKNTNIYCSGCRPDGSIQVEPVGTVTASGSNLLVNVIDSALFMPESDCVAAVRSGATITFTNTKIVSPVSNQPSGCENDGTINGM